MPEITETAAKPEVEKVEAEGSTESTKSVANGASENGVSSTSTEKKSPEKIDSEVLLAQGKRHLYIKDYSTAVTLLGDACAKIAELHGDLADECADAYFNYGRALLELAREESNVLGTEPEKEDSEENDEEDAEDDEDSKPAEDGEAEAKETGIEKGKEKSEDVENSKNEAKEKSIADETIDTTKEVSEEGEEAVEEDREEDVDNLQLAWEVFELAKKIYERQKDDVKLAQAYLYLGEVGMESENYVNAIDDMKKCVEIQKQILPPHHRDIAETHFQLGIACSLCNEFDEAVTNFKMSSEILEARIKELEENGAPDVDPEKNPFYSVEKEVAEIKELLPEIRAKITDMEDFKQETIKGVIETLKDKPQRTDGAGTSSSSTVANGATTKPATDISHLIKKKRKPEEETQSESPVKKSCTEEANK